MLTCATESSPKKRSPKKAKPGRPPKRASQLSQQETNVEAQQSQSPSVDLDASMQVMEIEDSSTNVLTSSAKEETIDKAFHDNEELHEESGEILPTTEDVATPDADIDIAATTNDGLFNIAQTADESMDQVVHASGATEAQATSPDIERVEETVINETTFKDESSPAPDTPESENDTTAEVIPATSSDAIETSVEVPVEEQISPPASDEIEPEISAFQSMRGKLESLIGDLKTAALSREEVHELEDLFFDAKKHLYNAEQRGRMEKSGMNM
jgi:hypothetical protein